MSSRDRILAAVRAANAHTTVEPLPVFDYRRRDAAPREETIARFLSRLVDYNVGVIRVARHEDVAAAASTRFAELQLAALAIPADLSADWRPTGLDLVEGDALGHHELDRVPGVMTGCACAIAETGTVILDGGTGQGNRPMTLLPDYHLCVVAASQVVGQVPEALERTKASVEAGAPLTFFSGPSATADIEFDRVVGVHGPRTLDIIFVDQA